MLSIIIPTLNEEEYLPKLLKSIRTQDFSDYEIIIADNSSTDNTRKIAKSFNCRIVQGGNISEGRNAGAKAAFGELLLFFDADTKLAPGDLEKMLSEFQKRELDLAAFGLKPFKNNYCYILIYNLFYNWPGALFQSAFPMGAACFLVKKEIHEKVRGFNEEIRCLEDFPYLRSIKRAGGKFGFIESVHVFFSERRYEKEGWIITHGKLILAVIYTLIFGPVKTDIFHYHFGKHK